MSSTARTLHALLIASTLIISVGAVVVSRATGVFSEGIALVELAALLAGAGLLLAVHLLRSRLPRRASSVTPDAWWQAYLGRAILLWALLELTAMLGAVSLLATRGLVGFGLLAAAALAGLLLHSPSRLAEE